MAGGQDAVAGGQVVVVGEPLLQLSVEQLSGLVC